MGNTGDNAWKNKEGKIKGQPIIETETNREIIDTYRPQNAATYGSTKSLVCSGPYT